LRRLSSALSTDLSGGADLLEVTYILVLRNLLKNFKQCGNKAYTLLRIIVPYLVLATGLYGATLNLDTPRTVISSLFSYLTAPLSAKIVVSAGSPANNDVLAWLAANGVTKDARTLALCDKSGNQFVDDGWGDMQVSEEDDGDQPSAPLRYIPDFGKYRFRFEGHFMSMERKDVEYTDTDGRTKSEGLDPAAPRRLVLECFPTLQGTKPLKRFLDHVNGYTKPSRENTTTIYRAIGDKQSWDGFGGTLNWTVSASRPARSLDSVALERAKKDAVVQDIAYYLTPECQRFYANRGYPYRRGFLLYGPPGTGKTSFSVALAGHFDLDVYILSMSEKNMSDQQLELLFSNLPDKCIVLLEDIDSAGLGRELSTAELKRMWEDSEGKNGSFRRFAEECTGGLTLSGLLNCIDGPLSKDGRNICLTTNAPDNLDPALVRPGRCDHKVLFGYASHEISTQLFEHLYTKRPDELVEGETSVSDDHNIPAMARAFAEAIPPDSMISPAEVQGYLMIHRQDPQAALDGAPAFAAEIIETKRRGANVAMHANEVHGAVKVTWGSPSSVVTGKDFSSDSDRSGEGDHCGWCGGDQDCECSTSDSKMSRRMVTNEKDATIKKHKSCPAEEPSSGLLIRALGLLRLVS
jgi:chaperone BCS1